MWQKKFPLHYFLNVWRFHQLSNSGPLPLHLTRCCLIPLCTLVATILSIWNKQLIVCLNLQIRKQVGVTLIIRKISVLKFGSALFANLISSLLILTCCPTLYQAFFYALCVAYFALSSILLIHQNLRRLREPCRWNCVPTRYNPWQSPEVHQCICTYFCEWKIYKAYRELFDERVQQ